MKRRYSVWCFRYNRLFMTKAQRRLGKDPSDGKLRWSDGLIVAGAIMLAKLDLTPEAEPYHELVQMIVSVALMWTGIHVNYFRRAPRPRYAGLTWAMGLYALFWSVIPFLVYWFDDESSIEWETVKLISLTSLVAWTIAFVYLGCWIAVRRRSRREIAMLRMRNKRRRKGAIYE